VPDIIEEKFNKWTGGCSPEKARIKIFEEIRDIPFSVVPELFSLDKGPRGMLEENRGFCVPKHYLLGMMYQKLGVPVRYHTYSFRWSEIDVDYPQDLKKLAKRASVTYHLACKAFIEKRWVLIDATWDSPLKKTGFLVNEDWDGRSPMKNAVKPLEEFIHEDARQRDIVFQEKLALYTLEEKLELSRFSLGLNQWLEELRK